MSGQRRPACDRAEVFREEMIMQDRITALLRDGPKTIPALADALGRPRPHVVCWVMAMRRYGRIEVEGRPDDEGYYSYGLTGGSGEPAKGGGA